MPATRIAPPKVCLTRSLIDGEWVENRELEGVLEDLDQAHQLQISFFDTARLIVDGGAADTQ